MKCSNYKSNFLSIVIFILLGFVVSVFSYSKVQAAEVNYPRIANFYLRTPITTAEAHKLARWDVLILHMLAQQNSADQIKLIRQINPDIKILVYIASQEFPIVKHNVWDPSSNGLFKKQLSGITNEMWLNNAKGDRVIFWQDNWMLNVTDYPASGRRWVDYLSDFVADELLSTGLWDGVFYDNSWYDVSWVQNGAIDANKDGRNDEKNSLDAAWRAGMVKLYKLTREKAGKPILIVGNGDRGYYGDINGIYFESFTTAPYISWEEKMRLYALSADTSKSPTIAIIGNTSQDPKISEADYRRMRFGLASSLMENGYYAYDAGSSSHAEIWWYDEYGINLGTPIGPAQPMSSASGDYYKDVWKREFTHGIAIVNSLAEDKEVDLGGDFEKLIGSQDASVNSGGIVGKVTIPAKDGLVMFKTYETVRDVLFVNGAFIRFVDYLGKRVRNGFFAYDSRYPGGARVIFTNLDAKEGDEAIVANQGKLEIFNSLGSRWFNDYPYGGNYKGDIRIAEGNLFEKEVEKQILVAPSYGGKIILYNYHGAVRQGGYYPFGSKYVGGYSVAAARLEGPGKAGSIVVGVGKGRASEVLIYDNAYKKLKKRFYPYGSSFKGGIHVAAGDVTGDSRDEIIVSAISGTNMPVRVFDGNGKKISEFKPSGLFGSTETIVETVDINYDGRLDIAIISL